MGPLRTDRQMAMKTCQNKTATVHLGGDRQMSFFVITMAPSYCDENAWVRKQIYGSVAAYARLQPWTSALELRL